MLIKSSVDSKPEKGEKAPGFNEGRLWRRAKLAAVFSVALLPSHPTRISTSSLWEQQIIRYFAKKRPLFSTLIVLQTEEAVSQGWGSRVLDCSSKGWDGSTKAATGRVWASRTSWRPQCVWHQAKELLLFSFQWFKFVFIQKIYC